MSLVCRNNRQFGPTSGWAIGRAGLFLFAAAAIIAAPVTYERILHADHEPNNWLTYSGDYSSRRYSELTQINHDNVKRLQLKWVYAPKTTFKLENTPLVVDG